MSERLSSDPGLGHLLTLGKLINLSKCLFPHLQNEHSNHNYFIKLCEEMNVMIDVKGRIPDNRQELTRCELFYVYYY